MKSKIVDEAIEDVTKKASNMQIAPTGGDNKSSDVMATENQPATLTAAEPKAVATSAPPTQPQNEKPIGKWVWPHH